MAEAAREACGLDRVDLVLSQVTLGKEGRPGPTPAERLGVLRQVAESRPWLSARVTNARLIADCAAGYDVVILGTDKWEQVVDAAWYDSPPARDVAVASLPQVALAPRGRVPTDLPPGAVVLDVALHDVSSTAVRDGKADWMLPEAVASGLWNQREQQPGR